MNISVTSFIPTLAALGFAPLLVGLTNRVKAIVAGRVGPPLLQVYYDLWKLLNKGSVYSRTTTWVFRASPIIGLAAIATAALLVPLGGCRAPLAFDGDLVLFAGLLGLARFFTILAALDVGSPFEGMGASRDVFFSALGELALFLALGAVAGQTGKLSLTNIHMSISAAAWGRAFLAPVLVAAALWVVFLAENSRIPVDDPNTHLELTMIHEVMILDHCGPDLAFLEYAATLKLWLLGALIVALTSPLRVGWKIVDVPLAFLSMGLIAIVLGAVESSMARLRLSRVSELLVGAAALAALALVLEFGGTVS